MPKLLARQYEEEYKRVTGKEIKVFQSDNIYEIDWPVWNSSMRRIQYLTRDQLRYFIGKLKEKPTKVRKG